MFIKKCNNLKGGIFHLSSRFEVGKNKSSEKRIADKIIINPKLVILKNLKFQESRNISKNHKTLSYDKNESKTLDLHQQEIKKELDIFRKEIEQKFKNSTSNNKYKFPRNINVDKGRENVNEINKCILK